MSEVGIIALAFLAFVGGVIVGVILISMCVSNEKYDDSEASYNYGFDAGYAKRAEEDAKNMDELCSHCGKRK